MEDKRRTARSLVAKLSSVSERTRTDALSELRQISKLDPESRRFIADAGAVPYLSDTLYSSSQTIQENAAATLLNLSITSRDSLMSTRGLLDALSHALSNPASHAAVQSCAAALHSLLIADESYRPVIGSKRDILYSLLSIVGDKHAPTRSIKDALKALFGIALYPLNRASLVGLGAVPALVSLIVRDARTGIVEDATAVLAQVAGCEETEEAMRKTGGVGVLGELLEEGSSASRRARENAVAALLNMARCGGERGRREVKEMGVKVMEGIAEVGENGSGKGKAKALELLKLLVDGNGNEVSDFTFKFHKISYDFINHSV
ncbi:putative LRR and NB-ARC domains-containing disease resistance protein [Hibiscus syriacus]|uniref:LRR and NB-ARC domains-containing disease resistance protein n=1 Tax=Hibiscus syriacus TaxID=106335 RepID=A0A6A3AH06_HIBSY|nr:U-box domain-containing protein 11-like [Hibiscus syriacus]KAE8702149.1 putative LRR and NB-ARC domains-containing disease resistance protein [Hibiscus syriacus]